MMNEARQTKIVELLLGVHQLDSYIALCLITVDCPICSQVNNDSSSYHGVRIVRLRKMSYKHTSHLNNKKKLSNTFLNIIYIVVFLFNFYLIIVIIIIIIFFCLSYYFIFVKQFKCIKGAI